ncbi:putative GTPase obgE [Candidatus Carsonella ruddii]|uniref:putative GTPase obgE n=1 Tax=Carsonella ruddii TaxID=114186 RepID=UPI00035C0875|nr:putative GTPase obgE [Candidatus Carsonella ruddii]AGS06647.1 putative GTPase obgE [Candidatus Carsonella ruddii DC]
MFIVKQFLIKSGNGGDGIISYEIRSGKFYADGGNGGDGGSVFFLINNNFKLPNKKIFLSNNGKNGLNKKKTGKKGTDTIIKLPIGVCIEINKKKNYIVNNNFFIKLLNGGKGGKGNFLFRKYFNSKLANFGKKGKIIFVKISFFFFYKECFIFFNNSFFQINNFNYKNNFISKIYVFFINLIFFKIFFKIIKFFLYFLYIKNNKINNYWIVLDGIELFRYYKKINLIKLIITPFFLISKIYYVGIKKFFHYLKIWKSS